jgi:hypothetical protein
MDIKMKEYPHILASTGQKFQEMKDAYIFDKLDGSLIRAEWSKKTGWYKFGSKTQLLDKNNPILGPAVGLFMNKYSESLTKLATDNKWQHLLAFCETFGPDSFAGTHPSGINNIVLFDLAADKKGIIGPKRFLKLTIDIETPTMLCYTNWTRGFVESIKTGFSINITTDNGQHVLKPTFEGVVGKSGDGHSLTMAKAKTQQWIDKVKNVFKDKADAILNS